MERTPEPELMDEEEQARAYAAADFSEPHNHFIELFRDRFPEFGARARLYVIDLGCGPGDVSIRFARAYPACIVHGIDGAKAMLEQGTQLLAAATDVSGRVELYGALLPQPTLPRPDYDAVISNSLLHHLAEPVVLWDTVRQAAAPGAPVFIMDLLRPQTAGDARRLVDIYMPDDLEILRRDFQNSLLAAYSLEEVRAQLEAAGLAHLTVEQVSDRHLAAWGTII